MNAVVLDGYTLNPGDLSWCIIEKLCMLTVYDSTAENEIFDRVKNAEVVFTNKVPLSKELILKLPKLRYIGVLATGYNIVDIKAAKELGITVTNIPAYSTESVAQLVFAFILHFFSRVKEHSDEVLDGKWASCKHFCYHSFPLYELAGKTLGIIGFGNIGKKTAEIGEAFNMKVIYANRSERKVEGLMAEQVSLEKVLTDSDIITLHCPLTRDTQHLINEAVLKKIKKSAVLINTGRGGLVDECALAQALHSGRITGYAADVLSSEPPSKDNPLLKAPNCLITPHIAWQTYEARERLMEIAADNLKSFINGSPKNTVSV